MTDERVAAVAARYDSMAAEYARAWSPVIRPMALPVFSRASIAGARIVLDIGCGLGSHFDDLRAAAPNARIAGVDRSFGMLARAPMPSVQADIGALPVGSGAVDAALCVFMLQHAPDPALAFKEIARAVNGVALIVTWGRDNEFAAEAAFHAALDEAGAATIKTVIANHDRFDSPEKTSALANGAGMEVVEAWSARAEHRYTRESMWESLAAYGRGLQRLVSLDADARERAEASARAAVDSLGERALRWRPWIVYTITRSREPFRP